MIYDFLFKNKTIRQTIFKNTFWLALSELVTSLLRFFLVIYAARVLGASEYGKFAFALSFVSLFAVGSDLGLSFLITREFSMRRENEQQYPAIISLKIWLSVLVILVTIAGSFFITQSRQIQSIMWILAIFIFSDGFFALVYPFIRARQRMEYEAVVKMSQTGLTFLLGAAILFVIPSAMNFSFAYLLASIVVLCAVAAYFHFFVYALKLKFSPAVFKELLASSWPLTFGFIGTWVYINIDSAMIGYFGTSSQVGWFNAASRLIFAIILVIASLFSRSFYPALSKFFKESHEALQSSWNYYSQTMVAIAVPLTVGGIVFADKIIAFLYGVGKYEPSGLVFSMLIAVASMTLICYPYSMILVVSGHQKKNFFIIIAGIAINAVLNAIFIPWYGFHAAAASTIASCVAITVLSFICAKKYTPIEPLHRDIIRSIIVSALSTLVMWLVIVQPVVLHLSIFLSLAIGLAVYAATFALLRKITLL